MPALFHAVYTNARGDRAGYREISPGPAPPWSRDQGQRFSAWLRGLRPVHNAPAWLFAKAGFRIGNEFFIAMARHRPMFSTDEHGRAAVLTHALLMPLDEGSPRMVETAMLNEHRRLATATDLAALRGLCCDHLETPSLSANAFLELPEEQVDGFFHTLATGRYEALVVHDGDSVDLADFFATVSAALPPRLRLSGGWQIGLETTAPPKGILVNSLPTGMAERLPAENVPAISSVRCRRALRKLAQAGALERINNEWLIRSWKNFLDQVERLAESQG